MNAKTSMRKSTAPPSTRLAHKTTRDSTTSRHPPASVPSLTKTAKIAKSSETRRKAGKSAVSASRPVLPNSPGTSKQARLIALLKEECGATLTQMMALTGWQAHTVRGTLSGVLRKRMGFNVNFAPAPNSGERVYRIVGAAASA